MSKNESFLRAKKRNKARKKARERYRNDPETKAAALAQANKHNAAKSGNDATEVTARLAYWFQEGKCPCGQPGKLPGALGPGRALNRDHNHRTNAFRLLLCNGCNTQLNRIEDAILANDQETVIKRMKALKPGMLEAWCHPGFAWWYMTVEQNAYRTVEVGEVDDQGNITGWRKVTVPDPASDPNTEPLGVPRCWDGTQWRNVTPPDPESTL